jgi:predicted MFS family arabinose efflux permease
MRHLLPFCFAIHAADQLTLAVLPLLATLLLGQGSPALAAGLVAAQGLAWLLLSLPAGVWVDRFGRRALLRLAPALAAGFLLLALLAPRQPLWLGLCAFLGAGGVVVAVLGSFAALPALVPPARLPAANARLELVRALATLMAPPLAGLLAAQTRPEAALLLAATLAAGAAIVALFLPALPRPATQRAPLLAAIAEGARCVMAQPLLRAIALTAMAWNTAFFALTAIAVPLALGPLGLSPQLAGLALGAQGAGLVAGALLAARLAPRQPAGRLLLAGPALSLLAMLFWAAALAVPGQGARTAGLVAAGQFLLGFGPMLWQVVQTSLRQVLAPPALLGRVGACMQVAVFGVRPLGALAGGVVAASFGLPAALLLAAGGFALSLAVLLVSPLPRLVALPSAA